MNSLAISCVIFLPSSWRMTAFENSFTRSLRSSYSMRWAWPSPHRSGPPSRFWRKVASLPGFAVRMKVRQPSGDSLTSARSDFRIMVPRVMTTLPVAT